MRNPAFYLFVIWAGLVAIAAFAVSGIYRVDEVIALAVVAGTTGAVLLAGSIFQRTTGSTHHPEADGASAAF